MNIFEFFGKDGTGIATDLVGNAGDVLGTMSLFSEDDKTSGNLWMSSGAISMATGASSAMGNISTLLDDEAKEGEVSAAKWGLGADAFGIAGGLFNTLAGGALKKGNYKASGIMQMFAGGTGLLGSVAGGVKGYKDFENGNKLSGVAGMISGATGLLSGVSDLANGLFSAGYGSRKKELEDKLKRVSEQDGAAPAGDVPAGDVPAGDAPAGDVPEAVRETMSEDERKELERLQSWSKWLGIAAKGTSILGTLAGGFGSVADIIETAQKGNG